MGKALLDVGVDPKDPHGQGYEPRPGLEEGADRWAFGRAHAAVHHVLQSSKEGNVSDVVAVLDAFSAEHHLPFGLGASRGLVLQAAVRQRGEVQNDASQAGSGLNLLILQAGLGGATLRCIPALLEIDRPASVYELVSVEEDHHLSDGSRRLVEHALGSGGTAYGPVEVDIRHTPLMPAEETTLAEVLETLMDGYELKGFDVVVLGGDRKKQQSQLETLLEQGALRSGAIVHGDGPPRGDASTEKYLEFLQGSGGHFDYEVHDVPEAALNGQDMASAAAIVVATLRDRQREQEL